MSREMFELPDSVFNALVNERRTMPLSLFREKFMGLLSHEAGDAPVALWMEDIHVRSPFVEVDVVDSKGTVVFTVPPLLDNSKPIFENLSGTQAVEAINHIDLHYKASPIQGKVYLDNLTKLTSRASVNPRYIAMWNNIRKFFNLPPIAKTVHADSKKTTTSAAKGPAATRYKPL